MACTTYADNFNRMLGHGRDLVRDLESGGNPSQPADGFVRYFNNAIGDLPRCREEEPRLRS